MTLATPVRGPLINKSRRLKRRVHRVMNSPLIGWKGLKSLSRHHRDRRSCRKLVFGLPWWPDRQDPGGQESVDILAAERRRSVAKHALAVVPVYGPAERLGRVCEGFTIH